MKRNLFRWLGIGLMTALILIGMTQYSTSRFQVGSPTLAQQTSPKPQPTPAASPAAQPSPKPSPAASPKPTPKPTPTPTPSPPAVEPLPLSESSYKDPLNRFQIGILQGYNIGFVGNFPLIESPDGNLAYTVVVKARESNRQLPDASLAQIAIETFERGEGFKPSAYQANSPGEVVLPWNGSLKIGAKTQPMQGKILARQTGSNIFLVLVSATENEIKNLDAALAALSSTLTAINTNS